MLEHHSNLALEDRKGEHWRRKILAGNRDAPVVFMTMAQVLEALFGGGTRALRRAHAMAKAVLVFDEVQTLPVRLVHLFNNALNLITADCGSTVVLCTGTQPLLDEVDAGRGRLKLASAPKLIEGVGGSSDGCGAVGFAMEPRAPGPLKKLRNWCAPKLLSKEAALWW